MRTFIFMTAALAVWAAALSAPALASQSTPFVQFLVEKTCSGQSTPFRSGCNGYLHKRVTQHKPAQQCLEEANDLCDHWYGTEPVKKAQCRQAVQFLNSRE